MTDLEELQASITAAKSAAKALGQWLKKYPDPTWGDYDAYTKLVCIAANTLSIQSEDDGWVAEDDIQAFCDGIKRMQFEAGIFRLIKDGQIGCTVKDGEIAVGPLKDS